MEDIPDIDSELVYLDNSIIEEIIDKKDPRKNPDEQFRLLEISQNGIFLGDTILGNEATQAYKVVKTGDIVYNPYRVNIGSIGVVPQYLDNSLVSPAYVVLRVKNSNYPPTYIVSVLKHPRYLRVIMNYALSSARASLPFSELIRIKIPKPSKAQINKLIELDRQLQEKLIETASIKSKMSKYTEAYVKPKDENLNHEDISK